MPIYRTRIVAAFVVPFLASLVACSAPQTQSESSADGGDVNYLQPLQTSPELRIRDLPVPAGFVYKPDKSVIFEYGPTLAATLLYEGGSTVGDVIAFYRREMEKFEWTTKAVFEREEVKMIFTKEGRYVSVTIRGSSGLARRTSITIDYIP